ncbi:hypothetical protein AeRB84_005255, partial [Aphanomyces euteiches]
VDKVVRQANQQTKGSLTIYVDGPYGKPTLDVYAYDSLVLLAGGIGVTPMVSMFNRFRQSHSGPSLHLYWVVRTPEELLAAETIMFPLPEFVKATFYVSEATEDGRVQASSGEYVPYIRGRPNLDECVSTTRCYGENVAVLACGPPAFVQEAQWHAHSCRFDFHKEVFLLRIDVKGALFHFEQGKPAHHPLQRRDDADKMEILTLAFAISAAMTLLTVLLSGWDVWTHLLYNPQAGIRKYVIRMLLMVPLYAVTSYLALTIPEQKLYFETIRDFYEGFVLHAFYYFMIDFLGGQEVLAQKLRSKKHEATHMMGFQWCLETWKMGPVFVRNNSIGILQYIPCKIFITVMTFVSSIFGFYGEGVYTDPTKMYPYLSLLLTVSQTWALYCLVLFYHGCSEELRPMRPLPKFLAVKMIIFFTFWQSMVIGWLARFGVINKSWHIRCKNTCAPNDASCEWEDCWTPDEISPLVNDFTICIEMLIFSLVHHYAFKIDDFLRMEREKNVDITNQVKGPLLNNFIDAIAFTDIHQDIRFSEQELLTGKQRLALQFDEAEAAKQREAEENQKLLSENASSNSWFFSRRRPSVPNNALPSPGAPPQIELSVKKLPAGLPPPTVLPPPGPRRQTQQATADAERKNLALQFELRRQYSD